jgi:AP-3 complex subunit delta-1
LKDDPYYIIDDTPRKPTEEEIDAIPVVRLEDMPSIVPGRSHNLCCDNSITRGIDASSRRPFLRATAQDFSSSDMFFIEKEGEMPENAIPGVTTAKSISSGQVTPIASGSLPQPAHLSSFPLYETPDDTRTRTPEPIKVVRSKKKATGGDKEKRKKRSTTTTNA